MEDKDKKGADPKLILAVQMLSIGIILIILGVTVFLLSPLEPMDPYIRKMSLISNSVITFLGLAFAIGGFVKLKKLKKT